MRWVSDSFQERVNGPATLTIAHPPQWSDRAVFLSHVGFNDSRTQALLDVEVACPALCGNGTTYLLSRRPDGHWVIVATQLHWIS
jgi:hypothetical protein